MLYFKEYNVLNLIEDKMKQLVINQLGDKFGYDTSLKDLEQYVNPMGSTSTQNTQLLSRLAQNHIFSSIESLSEEPNIAFK